MKSTYWLLVGALLVGTAIKVPQEYVGLPDLPVWLLMVFYFVNGERYEGTFVDDVREGFGTYVYKDSGRYVGSFMGGERHGRGVYTYASGARYEGEFVQGVMHGRGTYIFPDGTKMDGIWEKGEVVSSAGDIR